MADKTPAQRVALARHAGRPGTADYIAALFTDFFECRGDRQCREDASILGGVALYHGRPVTVVGHRKGRDLSENLKCNFGMPGPEGLPEGPAALPPGGKIRTAGHHLCGYSRSLPRPGGRGPGPGGGHRLLPVPALHAGGAGPLRHYRGGGQRRRAGPRRGQPGTDAGKRGLLRPLAGGLCLHPVEGRRAQRRGRRGNEAHGCRPFVAGRDPRDPPRTRGGRPSGPPPRLPRWTAPSPGTCVRWSGKGISPPGAMKHSGGSDHEGPSHLRDRPGAAPADRHQ